MQKARPYLVNVINDLPTHSHASICSNGRTPYSHRGSSWLAGVLYGTDDRVFLKG